MTTQAKTCFVIMPFSDLPGYETNHFSRVYENLIKPACTAAGFQVVRGDEVKGTNYIAIDILQRILKSELVVCDLSGKNPNVLYELAIRQAFDLPVVLLKDHRTDRIFDIQGLRTLDYNETLRVDAVAHDKNQLEAAVTATTKLESHEINSLVRLLGVEKATVATPTAVSPEASLILGALKDISQRLALLEETRPPDPPPNLRKIRSQSAHSHGVQPIGLTSPNGTSFDIGDDIHCIIDKKHTTLGTLVAITDDGLVLKSKDGRKLLLRENDPRFQNLTDMPF